MGVPWVAAVAVNKCRVGLDPPRQDIGKFPSPAGRSPQRGRAREGVDNLIYEIRFRFFNWLLPSPSPTGRGGLSAIYIRGSEVRVCKLFSSLRGVLAAPTLTFSSFGRAVPVPHGGRGYIGGLPRFVRYIKVLRNIPVFSAVPSRQRWHGHRGGWRRARIWSRVRFRR